MTTAGNWSTVGNWSPAVVPGTAFGDTATINVNISGSRTVTLDSVVTLGALSLGDIDGSNIYTLALSSGSLTFDQSGNGSGTANLTQLTGSEGDTISAGFSLNDNLAITNNSATSGLLTLSGAITNGGFGGKGLIINAGAVALTSAASTFSAGVTVETGAILRFGANSTGAAGAPTAGPLGTGTLTLNGGQLVNNVGGARTVFNAVTLGGDVALGDAIATGKINLSGPINLGGATRSLTLTNKTEISGVTSNGGLTLSGTGSLELSGANTYAGGTTLNGGILLIGVASAGSVGAITSSAIGTGTLQLNGGVLSTSTTTQRTLLNAVNFGGDVILGDTTVGGLGNLTFSATANLGGATRSLTLVTNNVQFDGIISNGGLTKTGQGTLTLTGANTFAGGLTLNEGTVIAATSTSAFGGSGTGAIALGATSGAASATVQGAGSTYANPITVRAGSSGTLTLMGSGGTGTTTFSGGVTLNHDLTLDSKDGTLLLTTVGLSGANTLNIVNSAATPVLTSHHVGLNVASPGFTGNVAVTTGGTLRVTNAAALSAANTVQVNSGALFELNNVNQTIAGLNDNGGAGGTVTVLTGSQTLTLGGTGAYSYGGVLQDNASLQLSLTKSGTGTQVLSGTNSYTGGTTLAGGTLNFTTGGLGTTGAVSFTGNATLQYGSSTTTDLSSRLAIGNGVTGTIDTNGNNVTFATGLGASDSGALTKAGTGTLSLNGVNTYTGLTTVTGGTLAFGSSGGLVSGNALSLGVSGAAVFANEGQTLGAVSNANTATNALNFTASTGTVTLASLSGAGSTRFGRNGVVTGGISAGTVTAVGTLTADISGGTTTVGGVATIGTLSGGTANLNGATSAITTLNGGTVNLGSGSELTVSAGTSAGAITGSGGSLTKASGGTLTLTGANSYTGLTTVGSGTLALHAAAGTALSATNAVAVASGATVSLGAANQVNSAATLTLGGGTLKLNGFDQTLGTLALTANATLDLGATANLAFADSHSLNWGTSILRILNFTSGTAQLSFGGTSGGLTPAQLGLFQFTEFGNSAAQIDANGFITPLSANIANVGDTDLVIASPITGTTSVTQNGTGSITLTAPASTPNTSTGAATVTAGTLVIGTAAGGNWAGDVSVSGTGTLKGRGTIGGAVVVNPDGTYSPGNSPAIQSVGSLTVNTGGVVVIELDGATAGNGAGFHDKVVSLGAVTLNGGTLTGATIFSGSTGYTPALGAAHTIITGTAVTGTFTTHTFNPAANAPSLSFLPVYSATALNLVTVPANYATAFANLSANQTQVGNALQTLRPQLVDLRGSPGATDVLFNRLSRLDAVGLLAAYNELNPEPFSALSAASMQGASMVNSVLQQRSGELRQHGPATVSLNGVARAAPAEAYPVETVIVDGVSYLVAKAKPQASLGYFANATGAFADVEAGPGREGYSSRAGGASCGFDYALNEHHTVGLVVGQYYSDAAFAAEGGSAQTSSQRLGVFYDYQRNGFYLNTSVSAGLAAYETQRQLSFLGETARGETEGLSVGGQVALGYDFKVGNYILGPNASVAYDHTQINGFTETGSAGGLSVGRQQADSLVTNWGVHVARPFTWQRIGWIPAASFAVSRQHYSPNRIDARLGAGGQTMSVRSQAAGSEYVNPGVSLTALLAQGWSVRVGYEAILNPASADHRLSLNVSTGF